jgi:phosphoglycolate phosphatase-like HAD superfamily hydrolase
MDFFAFFAPLREISYLPTPQVALFDFDGTLSLIRTGWQDVMIPMMIDVLQTRRTAETRAQLRSVIEAYVWRLTGKETIYQMYALADELKKRGGTPEDPLVYKREFLRRLQVHIAVRTEGLRKRSIPSGQLLVPGARQFLQSLRDRNIQLYLASGTDHEDVIDEARLLQIDHFFEGRIYGARDDMSFSKAKIVREILENAVCQPEELLGFGDGYVEIEEVKRAGGYAVGIATNEPDCLVIDDWKRQRLLDAGADLIIPNFLDPQLAAL